jgi:hypothetical protein
MKNSALTRAFAGKLFVYWYGSEPRLCLTDTAMIQELLSSKYAAHATGKSWLQRQGTRHFIGRGLLMANGASWSHQRHVVAPSFMADKLKVRRCWHCLVVQARLLTSLFACRRGAWGTWWSARSRRSVRSARRRRAATWRSARG